MAAICRSTIIKESTPLTSEWALRSLRNDHAVYVGMGTPLISEWLRRSVGICIMNNMFNKDKIAGMVFNPNDEKMVIVLKDVLLSIMPGEKPKPEFYGE